MKAPDCIVIDFETEAIQQRPAYPPVPVGVAIKWPQQVSHYYAFGHPVGNNCSRAEAAEALGFAWRQAHIPLLFFHAKFDLQVACEKLKLPEPPWQRAHDAMFLSFLADPHARKLSLKELAADLLQWPAEEQDELHAWIWEHRVELETTYGGKVEKAHLGAWIAKAPGELVAKYAVGDVERTLGLFNHLYPLVHDNGMGEAYDRERRLMPIFMDNERVGMRVDQDTLAQDVEGYSWHMDKCETWLRQALGADLNFDADREVANALLSRGIVPEELWTRTKGTKSNPQGQLSVSKDNLLPEMFTGLNGAQIASALGYRNRLKTCLSMFMEPWLRQAAVNKGYITTNWNQTRGYDGGTRSGRPSTFLHNFLNLSKIWEGRDDGYQHPAFLSVAPLPLVRKYVLPDEGGVFLHRDFDGQEMRVFAHGECGALQQQYRDNPKLDPHTYVGQELMAVAGREIDRTKVKTLNFQGLYGGGVPALQRKLRVSYAQAKELKAFHDRALPGRKLMVDAIKAMVVKGEPIRTWGGRLYWCEPSRVIDGRMRSMDYKLINYYCQGSAADITKQALVEWYEGGGGGGKARFLVTVYDEIDLTAAKEGAKEEMLWLKEVMEKPRLDIEMLSSGKWGPNWGSLEKCA